MIRADLDRSAAGLLGEVLAELSERRTRRCAVVARFIEGGLEHEFQITYVGPSRRAQRRPSMTGSNTRSK